MGISVSWSNSDRAIMLYTVRGIWFWNDLQQALGEARAWHDAADHAMNIIIDLRLGEMGESPLWQGKRVINRVNAYDDRVVFVGAPPFMKAMFNTFRRLYPDLTTRVFFVPSVEEAQTLLGLLTPPARMPLPAKSLAVV